MNKYKIQMPEGPEVATVADCLRPYLTGRIIIRYALGERAKAYKFDQLSTPCTITGVRSYGKKVIFDLNTGYHIITSLGMSGRLTFTPGNHTHIRFDIGVTEKVGVLSVVKSTFSIYFDDQRYMGNIEVVRPEDSSAYFNALGPDLLQAARVDATWITQDQWHKIFKGRRRAMCDVLTMQELVSGIGWYLMTDILYYSGIHPERRSDTLTKDEWELIRVNAHKVIRLSYAYGGFTIESFISPDGKLGNYPAAIYGKQKDSVGHTIVHKKISASRSIHYVEEIQK
jgi:formamidopyrimidine-DNA glycosylase